MCKYNEHMFIMQADDKKSFVFEDNTKGSVKGVPGGPSASLGMTPPFALGRGVEVKPSVFNG